MADWVPFFQTLLWVLLIGGALWKFNAQVTDVLEAIRDRVKTGANIKAGPFEIGESLPAQTESAQRREISAEVAEATPTTTTADPNIVPSKIRTDAFLAEDLAIRELQLEFGVSISRQVALGPDSGIDGMFAKGGRGYFVEMKYMRRAIPDNLVCDAIEQFQRYVSRYHWKNIAMVLVIVLDDNSLELKCEQLRIEQLVAGSAFDVHVRVFSYDELKRKYGFEDGV